MQYLIQGLGQILNAFGYVLLSVAFSAVIVSRKSNLDVRCIVDFRLDQPRIYKNIVMFCRVTQSSSHQCNHQFYIG